MYQSKKTLKMKTVIPHEHDEKKPILVISISLFNETKITEISFNLTMTVGHSRIHLKSAFRKTYHTNLCINRKNHLR